MDHGILIIGYYLGCAFLKEYVGDLDPQSTPPPPPPQKKKKGLLPHEFSNFTCIRGIWRLYVILLL